MTSRNSDLTITARGGSRGIIGTAIDRAVAGEPIDRLAANLAESYRGWLLVD